MFMVYASLHFDYQVTSMLHFIHVLSFSLFALLKQQRLPLHYIHLTAFFPGQPG